MGDKVQVGGRGGFKSVSTPYSLVDILTLIFILTRPFYSNLVKSRVPVLGLLNLI